MIRCELALQPTQLLALVEEALAAFPTMRRPLVMLSTEEFNRLRDAVPEKSANGADAFAGSAARRMPSDYRQI